MKTKCFSIFDDKAKAFLPPFFYPETGMALRAFQEGLLNKDSFFGKFPEDYTLFFIGIFDNSTGAFEPSAGVEALVNGRVAKAQLEKINANA